ncbi:hypothetical protein L580_2523 [Serratia fonticola AU-P3(3)]|nr:hypothetical protein L580_2523 [Serratia fonticola AU-P3(3)]
MVFHRSNCISFLFIADSDRKLIARRFCLAMFRKNQTLIF